MATSHLKGPLPQLGQSTTLPSRLHDLLEAAIIDGTFHPGERIHADVLAAHYGVSRIPVREALRSLNEAGWVDIKPHHGVHVRERTETELTELFEVRAVVEATVARWAATRRDADDLERLRAATVHPDAPLDDDDVIAASGAFYVRLRAAARNDVLAATSAALEKRARFYFSTVVHQLGTDWMHVHLELVEHVAARRSKAAADLAARHITHTGEAVKALLFP